MRQEVELTEDEMRYRLSVGLRAAERQYLNAVIKSHIYRSYSRSARSDRFRNADVLSEGIKASVIKRDMDTMVRDSGLIFGAENDEFVVGQQTVFSHDTMRYQLEEVFGEPPDGTPVTVIASQISEKTDDGLEVVLPATCVRHGEEGMVNRMTPREPRYLHRSVRSETRRGSLV